MIRLTNMAKAERPQSVAPARERFGQRASVQTTQASTRQRLSSASHLKAKPGALGKIVEEIDLTMKEFLRVSSILNNPGISK